MPGYVKTREEIARIEKFLKPARFTCDKVGIDFTTSWEFAREVLPPIFEPIGDRDAGIAEVHASVTHLESAYCGPMDSAIVTLACSYDGRPGGWMLTEIVSNEFPVVIGRELWGEVKKMGEGRVWRDGTSYHGEGSRRGQVIITIDATIDGPELAPFQRKSEGFDIKMFPHSNVSGLQYPPLLNIWDMTYDYTSYREGTGSLTWGYSEWDPVATIPILETGTAVAAQYAGTWPLGEQIELEDPDNIYPLYLWGRAYDEPTRFPIAQRWRGLDELNEPPAAFA